MCGEGHADLPGVLHIPNVRHLIDGIQWRKASHNFGGKLAPSPVTLAKIAAHNLESAQAPARVSRRACKVRWRMG